MPWSPAAINQKPFGGTFVGRHDKRTIRSAPARQTIARIEPGTKWKADSSTNNNVANLKSILIKFDAANNKSVDAYKQLGNELQAGLDKMIKECKMGGADHDALHKWLEPLIKQVNDLKSSADEKSAEAKTTEIREQLNVYSQFFE